jgi:hypothetical protein
LAFQGQRKIFDVSNGRNDYGGATVAEGRTDVAVQFVQQYSILAVELDGVLVLRRNCPFRDFYYAQDIPHYGRSKDQNAIEFGRVDSS